MNEKLITQQIESSWQEAMRKINSKWSIDGPKENSQTLSAKGIFHSPTRDINKPFPIIMLEFTLKYNNTHKFLIDFGNQKIPPKLNERLQEIKELYDVSKFLDECSNVIFDMKYYHSFTGY